MLPSNHPHTPVWLLDGLLSLFQLGCDEAETQAQVPAASEAAPAIVMSPIRIAVPLSEQKKGLSLEELRAMTPDEARASLRHRREMSTAIRVAVASSESWEEADAAVRAEMERHPNVPDYITEQTAALLMLDHHLLGAPASAASREAIGFYTTHLLENESPNAHLLDRSLDALAGHWEEARIAAAAETALAGAQRYLQGTTDWAGCSIEEILDRSSDEGARHGGDLGALRTLLDKASK
jgi:hypothetical protein